MKTGKLFVCVLTGLVVMLLSSCQDKKQDDDFSGVGRLISSRNKARYEEAKNPAPEKKYTNQKETTYKKDSTQSESKTEQLSSIVLYEENVKILGSNSGQTLAEGVAYINKKGEIVKIKILKK